MFATYFTMAGGGGVHRSKAKANVAKCYFVNLSEGYMDVECIVLSTLL